jgi:hypothetical protein
MSNQIIDNLFDDEVAGADETCANDKEDDMKIDSEMYQLAMRPINLMEVSTKMIGTLIIPLVAWTIYCYTRDWTHKITIWILSSILYTILTLTNSNLYGEVSTTKKNITKNLIS